MPQNLTTGVWKTALLTGDLKTGSDSCHALRSGGCDLNAIEEEILKLARFRVDHGGKKLDLVVLSVAGLGFDHGSQLQKIYDRAFERGYTLCPHELAAYLRLQYKDQPEGEGLMVAMEPIVDLKGSLNIFHIGHDMDGLWIGAHSFETETDLWYPKERFIFVRSEE